MDDRPTLSARDISNISKLILDWLRNCPYIPTDLKLKYQYLDDHRGISLHTMKGAIKEHSYVGGGYEGLYPFAIYLRDSPDSTNEMLDCSLTLNSIGEWVQDQDDYPDLEDGEINSIEWLTNANLVQRFEDGIEDWMITFELRFEKD